jgi:WD40 repeat protein
MVMALSIFHSPTSQRLTVLAGFESGHTSVSSLSPSSNPVWQTTYTSQSHTQPILSLAPSPDKSFYLTSSADAIIAKHPIPASENDDVEGTIGVVGGTPIKTLQSKHAGQQGLRIRNDGLVFATAGWDSKIRVYSCKSIKELAVLKWHKEGCYSVAFADVTTSSEHKDKDNALENQAKSKEVIEKTGALTVKGERLRKAETAHWIAAGSKDGKVSLWDIY